MPRTKLALPIIDMPLKKCPLGKRALRYEGGNRYGGWTGYQEFGVIQCYRYFGWCVTCWATILVDVYGHNDPCFHQFADAVAALDRLMNIAEHRGELETSKRVEYWEPPGGWPPRKGHLGWWRHHGFESIHPHMRTDSRAMHSPATLERVCRRHKEAYNFERVLRLHPPPHIG